MITRHPAPELILAFASGELSAGYNTLIAAHIEMCPQCQRKSEHLESHLAFMWQAEHAPQVNFGNMAELITGSVPVIQDVHPARPLQLRLDEHQALQLPTVMRHIRDAQWHSFRHFSVADLLFGENGLDCYLVHARQGGSFPALDTDAELLLLVLDGELFESGVRIARGEFHQFHWQCDTSLFCHQTCVFLLATNSHQWQLCLNDS